MHLPGGDVSAMRQDQYRERQRADLWVTSGAWMRCLGSVALTLAVQTLMSQVQARLPVALTDGVPDTVASLSVDGVDVDEHVRRPVPP